MKKSLGLIETIGLTAGIVAADTAVKSANVELIGYELTKGSGMTVIKLEGDVGAVTAAVAAAASAASAVGKVVSTKVIPRPAAGLESMISNSSTIGFRKDISEDGDAPNNDKEETVESVPIGEKTLEVSEENLKGNTDIIEENVPQGKEADEEETSEEILPEESVLQGTDVIQEDALLDEVIDEEADSEEIIQEETILDEDVAEEKVKNSSGKDVKISQVSKKKGTAKKNGQKNTVKGSKSNKDDQ